MNAGKIVLCDRYAFSGIAFSAAKGLPLPWCRAPDIGLPQPDLVLFLDISIEAARERGGYGEERYEKEELQKRVKDVFITLRDEEEGHELTWKTVDAGRERDVVEKELWQSIKPLINGVQEPIGSLWSS
jgi:dTMP kinase